MSTFKNRFVFYGEALKATRQVGAFTFTSKIVAEAVVAPVVRRAARPIRVLEVGAGTGAITRAIVQKLGQGDVLDLYEINAKFAELLRAEFGGSKDPEVHVHEGDILEMPAGKTYDAIVSSLPLLNMPPEAVRKVFALYIERLEPDGVLTYYDYWAKEIRRFMGRRHERRRIRDVIGVTRQVLEKHEYHRRVIPWNMPPALVHYLRKDK